MSVLSIDRLEELLDRLVASGGLRKSEFVTGVSPKQFDAELSRAGLNGRVGMELELWWRWLDGFRSDHANPYRTAFGGFLIPLPLHTAVSHYDKRYRHERIRVGQGSSAPEDEDVSRWFPIAGNSNGFLRCELDTTGGSRSRLTVTDDAGKRGIEAAEAPSLGTVVDHWIDALRLGIWRFEESSRSWVTEGELPGLPAEHRRFVYKQLAFLDQTDSRCTKS